MVQTGSGHGPTLPPWTHIQAFLRCAEHKHEHVCTSMWPLPHLSNEELDQVSGDQNSVDRSRRSGEGREGNKPPPFTRSWNLGKSVCVCVCFQLFFSNRCTSPVSLSPLPPSISDLLL